MKLILIPVTLVAATVLGACDTTNARKIDAHIGESAANLVRAQTYDPRAADAPPALGPQTSDGQRLKAAMDKYHKDVPAPEEKVTRPIVFEVGGGGSGGGSQ
jgi:hypothetical protein